MNGEIANTLCSPPQSTSPVTEAEVHDHPPSAAHTVASRSADNDKIVPQNANRLAEEIEVEVAEDGVAAFDEFDSTDGGDSLDDDLPDDLLFSESEDEGYCNQVSPVAKTEWTEQVRMIHLRRYIDQLAEKVQDQDRLVQKTREELKKCQQKAEQLEQERDQVFCLIQDAENNGNMAAVYRLRAQHERICRELTAEQELEFQIATSLESAEYDLGQAQLEQGKMLLAENDLATQEEKLRGEKLEAAQYRNRKEQKYADQSIRTHNAVKRAELFAKREEEKRHKHALNEARHSQEKASKYLKKTMSKIKQREAEEAMRQKKHMQKRMEAMLGLKSNITANRENLKAIQARDRVRARQQQNAEDEQCLDILAAGGNPSEHLIKEKILSDFEQQKQLFAAKQRERQVQIAEKILLEEEMMKKRRLLHPELYVDPKQEQEKIVKPHKTRKLKVFDKYAQMSQPPNRPLVDESKFIGKTGDESDSEEEAAKLSSFSESKDKASLKYLDSSSEDENDVDLARPEFEGLWDKHKPYKVPKDASGDFKLPGASKMQKDSMLSATDNLLGLELFSEEDLKSPLLQSLQMQIEERRKMHAEERVDALKLRVQIRIDTDRKEIMQRVLKEQREGILIKQVAGGREFKGRAFYSKPDTIHFKDFVVGKTYKKVVTLTNVSYTVNYCRLMGLTEHLKDFIELQFDPPGQMSAGLTCDLLVTFKPMINEDLVGEANFLAQTGPFAIPIICSTKKCDLKVHQKKVDFGTAVIGETLKRTVTLVNSGALGTKVEFYRLSGIRQQTETSAETSLGRLTSEESQQNVDPDIETPGEAKLVTDKGGKKNEGSKEEKKNEEKPLDKPTEEDEPGSHQKEETEGEDQEGKYPEENKLKDGGNDPVVTSVVMSGMLTEEVDELASLDGMKVGRLSSGEIAPHSELKLEIIWQPTIPGNSDAEFMVAFSDQDSENIKISATATAIDVPVWVERRNVDLKICMFDRLYQDNIIVSNRATSALRLKFEVCKELRNHLELLPKTGYIQAQSQFSAQLKFLPRESLFEEAGKYFDKETGVLEAPMMIRVADQTRPVPFTVHAIVTNSDMEFDVQDIDFGYCTVHEAVTATVKLTNRSILPQQFGFVGIPEYLDVQPNDGFGTLLPLETIELDMIFQPLKAQDYKFELTCKSLINREFKIRCQGIGVLPPLELSKQVIHFSATALNDFSTASLHVVNSHSSKNEFTHPVPRIGKGEVAPVGPTSFEFVTPAGAPVNISPSVGTVEPGKKVHVQVRFAPSLADADIRKEAVRITTELKEQRMQEEYKAALEREKQAQEEAAQKKPPKKGKASPKADRQGKVSDTSVTVKGPPPVLVPKEEEIDKNCDEYAAAQASLLRKFRAKFQTLVIPCYVSSGSCADPGKLPYSVYNTLYLEVHLPTVKPQLVVISDRGRPTTNFGDVSIGQTVIKHVIIQNISNQTVDLKASTLNPGGPFLMLNALRVLAPNATHTILVNFTPLQGELFQEELGIQSPTSTLHLTLKGRGVSPVVNLSVKDGVLDMGAVLAGEYREETFEIANTSMLSVQYSIKLDSQSLLRYSKSQGLPSFITRDAKMKTLVGAQNNSGLAVFDCVPIEGKIPAGGSKKITVTFAPDHPSDHYSDAVRTELFGQEEQHVFQLVGQAKPHIMYLAGHDSSPVNVESLAVLPVKEFDEEEKPPPIPLQVSLYSIANETDFATATTEIQAGCVRTMAISQKKNGEWIFESMQSIASLGFDIEPTRGMVEAGTSKTITITWKPPSGHNPNVPVEASINCTLKSDVTETYRLLLRGFVVTE